MSLSLFLRKHFEVARARKQTFFVSNIVGETVNLADASSFKVKGPVRYLLTLFVTSYHASQCQSNESLKILRINILKLI